MSLAQLHWNFIMHPMLTIATRAARNAGDLIQRSAENVSTLPINKKSKNHFVAEIERVATAQITKVLNQAYPEHSILAAQSGEHQGNDYIWAIDPLVGSSNYLHGYPYYAVSVALKHKGKIIIAVVYDPIRNDLFVAQKGGGAMLNNRRIRVSEQNNIASALVASGLPTKFAQYGDAYAAMFKTLAAKTAGIRCTGSTALNLGYLAAGRLDACWEIKREQWAMAAGVLLVQEAGGVVTDFSFDQHHLKTGNIIAGNIDMHQALYQEIKPYISEQLR